MYVILVYDINQERVSKVKSVVSSYLVWRQRSVFDGKITKSKLNNLIEELKDVINYLEDYIIIFSFPNNVNYEVMEMGIKRYSDPEYGVWI